MPDFILVDTDILIDIARGTERTSSFIDELKQRQELAISTVTEMELLVGCRNKTEFSNLESFLSDYRRIKLDSEISDETLTLLRQFRLSHGLLIADALIAATAIVTGAEFVTKNVKHYRFIPGLNLMPFS